MHRIGWTFVRLTAENRVKLDRVRKHAGTTRDRLVNTIIRDFLESAVTRSHSARRRRRAA
jgi:hypothetical protein